MKKTKKIIIVASLIVFALITGIFGYNKIQSKDAKPKGMFAIYIDEGDGNGPVASTSNVWPTDGYELDLETSFCDNGSTLSWDNTNKTVGVEATTGDKCKLYFIKSISSFAEYLKTRVYGTDSTLYLHSDTATGNNETSISNWTDSEAGNANDGAYRYSGPDTSVENYVCFNYTDESVCSDANFATSDYAYRIISIEGDNIKLIKAQPLSSERAWNSNSDVSGGNNNSNEISETKPYKVMHLAIQIPTYNDNDWAHSSTLNTYLNNDTTGYLSTFSYSWRTKIATGKTWYIGGYSIHSVKVKTFYNAEHGTCSSGTCSGTTDTSTTVGLMNVYDYGYATSPTNWNTDTLGNYNNSTISANNWLYRSINSSVEWTITPYSSSASFVWNVYNSGSVDNVYACYFHGVRPVLYLSSSVNYVSGTGASDDPYIIE